MTRLLTATLVLGVASAILGLPILLDGPSETEAAQAVADQVNDARVDEWLQAAKRANPHLTEHELIRIRAAAIYIEQRQKQP
ncbi:MAG: hypothetical protein Q4F13_02605 [Pseudomonadota bacterium]|nr:hypothetical protein [Pseudomonadota bacterium]